MDPKRTLLVLRVLALVVIAALPFLYHRDLAAPDPKLQTDFPVLTELLEWLFPAVEGIIVLGEIELLVIIYFYATGRRTMLAHRLWAMMSAGWLVLIALVIPFDPLLPKNAIVPIVVSIHIVLILVGIGAIINQLFRVIDSWYDIWDWVSVGAIEFVSIFVLMHYWVNPLFF